jgi:hypothetical protein
MSTQPLKFRGWWWVVGIAVVVVGAVVFFGVRSAPPKSNNLSGPEGTQITISYPKTLSTMSGPVTASFYDAGEHGWNAVNNGAATYVTYDTSKGLTYTAPAEAVADVNGQSSYTVTVSQGICGLIIQSSQEQAAPPKTLSVTLIGSDGKAIPGAHPTKFDLKCDKYTLNATAKASADPVLPDGVSQSIITATLTVTGPAQFVNGMRVKPSDPKIILVSPLGLVMVHFNNSLGTIAPNPANVKTDLNGNAVVNVSSADAGIDKVQAIATGIGDAIVNVHFPPKITDVQENFVQPNSPTNYQMSTIPVNPKDLTFDWEIIRPAGPPCGNLIGPASGLGESKNGFFHGPTSDFPNGCDEKYEFATQIKVTITDKDGESDTKTFSARALEGQGVVKLP